MLRTFYTLAAFIVTALFFVPDLAAQGSREQWMNEIQQYKRSYFTKELNLTKEQQAKFFPLYEEMDQETNRISEEARLMEKHVSETPEATDLEFEKATEAMYDAKVKEAGLEREYLDKFKQILDKKQLFELKGVERKFSREMMRQHNRIRSSRLMESK